MPGRTEGGRHACVITAIYDGTHVFHLAYEYVIILLSFIYHKFSHFDALCLPVDIIIGFLYLSSVYLVILLFSCI